MICLDQFMSYIGVFLFALATLIQMVLNFMLSNKYGYLKQYTIKKNQLEKKIQIYSWVTIFISVVLIIVSGILKFHLQKYNFCL